MSNLSPALLREIGEALDGNWLPSRLAARIGKTDRTVRRWANAEWPVPGGVAPRLAAAIDARIAELRELKRKLR